MLAIALGATLCSNVFINGAAFLIPTLHSERGLDLSRAGLISAMPSFGMVVTLIAWGYVVDRVGERLVLTVGSALTAVAAFAAAWAHSLVGLAAFLFLGGMAAASSNSASARVVVGWFPPEQRGLVMGIRQTAQPLGVGLGALVIPRLAQSHGVSVALLFPAIVCTVAAVVVAVGVRDLDGGGEAAGCEPRRRGAGGRSGGRWRRCGRVGRAWRGSRVSFARDGGASVAPARRASASRLSASSAAQAGSEARQAR